MHYLGISTCRAKGANKMEITKEQVLSFLSENKEVINEVLTATHIENYLSNQEGQKLMQPKLDKYFNKGLETWKQNNLEKLIDEEIAKRYPEETPEMREIRALKQQLEQKEREAVHRELTILAQRKASEIGVPTELASYFIADNEELTIKNVEKFDSAFKSHVDAAVIERTKGTTPKMTASQSPKQKDVKHMSFSEFAAYHQNKI